MFAFDRDDPFFCTGLFNDNFQAANELINGNDHQLLVHTDQRFAFGAVDKNNLSIYIIFYVTGKPGAAGTDDSCVFYFFNHFGSHDITPYSVRNSIHFRQ